MKKLVFALALLCTTLLCRATDWYVDSGITGADAGGITGYDTSNGTAGSDSNAGTAAAPFLTLTKLATVVSAGDTCHIAGRFYTPDATASAFAKTDMGALTIKQWAGRSPAQVRGDNKIDFDTVWDAGDGDSSFKTNIGAGLGATLAAVSIDYDLASSIDADGRHIAFLRRVAAAADCDNVGDYHYDNSTGVITVHAPFGADPSSQFQVNYAVRLRNGFKFSISSGTTTGPLTIDGIRFCCWPDSANTNNGGDPILITGGSGCTIKNCTFDDFGFHGLVFVAGRCENNRSINNVFRGMSPSGTAIAFYADSGFETTNCLSSGDTFYLNNLLGLDTSGEPGLAVEQGTEISAIICHGGTAANSTRIINPRCIQYTPISGAPDLVYPFQTAGSSTPIPSDPTDPATYAVQVIQTNPEYLTIENGTAQLSVNSIAYVNCRMHFTQYGASGLDHALGDLYPAQTSKASTSMLFYGCEAVVNMNTTANATAAFRVGRNNTLRLVNTSVLDSSTTTGAGSAYPHVMFKVPSNDSDKLGAVTANKCVFGFRATAAAGNDERRFVSGDADDDAGGAHVAVPAANLAFRDCLTFNVTAAKYSAQTAYDTAAEWFRDVDPNGVELTTQPFADCTGATDLALRTTGTAWEMCRYVAPYVPRGADGYDFAGHYGAHQRSSTVIPSGNRQSIIQR